MQEVAYGLYGNMYLNITNKCTNSCSFCIRNTGDGVADSNLRLEHEPDYNEVINAIKAFESKCEYKEAVFCGFGEPTMNLPVLLDVAEYLKGNSKFVRLNTNGLGSIINGVNLAPKLKYRVDKISVSLNAPNRFLYEKICSPSVDNSFKEVKDFITECVAFKIDTEVTVVDILSPEKIEEAQQLAESLKVKLRVRKYIPDNYADQKKH